MAKKSRKKAKSINKSWLALATGLILLSFGIISYYFLTSRPVTGAPTSVIKSEPAEINTNPVITGTPVRIQVPSVGIDLKIIPGEYFPKLMSWSLSLDKAHFAGITTPPNNKQGLTFMYAHNRKGVFSNLPKIKPGEEVLITTDNGHLFRYKFVNSVETTPRDTSIFTYQGKPLLVLQTCSGLWYQNRQLFKFDLDRVE